MSDTRIYLAYTLAYVVVFVIELYFFLVCFRELSYNRLKVVPAALHDIPDLFDL